MRNIIAFVGRAGSGKDYQCSKLVEQGYTKLAFADILRELACSTLNIDYNYMLDNYDKLKSTELINGQNFRNILENLGSAIRKYSPQFFADAIFKKVTSPQLINQNICISDLRYINEYYTLQGFNVTNSDTYFKCIFCDYRSDRYQETNTHESAWLSNMLHNSGYCDLQELTVQDIQLMESKQCQ